MWALIGDLDAFLQEHRRCGELDSGVEQGRVWMTCECGAQMARLLPAHTGPIA
jgi:hypothetical protein